MGDADLAAFFARKANKKKEKKKKSGIINIEDVGQHLERRANIEILDDEEEDGGLVQLTNTRANMERKNYQEGEDSEWIDFTDRPSLNDFAYNEFTEKDMESEEEKPEEKPAKTWNTDKDKDKNGETNENVSKPKSTPSKYVAPSSRKLDITSEEMFPSIDVADKIAKHEKQQEKLEKIELKKKIDELIKSEKESGKDRTRSTEEVKNKYVPPIPTQTAAAAAAGRIKPTSDMRPTAWQPKTTIQSSNADAVDSWRSTRVTTKESVVPATTQALPKSPAKQEKLEAKSGAYVPPHLRNK